MGRQMSEVGKPSRGPVSRGTKEKNYPLEGRTDPGEKGVEGHSVLSDEVPLLLPLQRWVAEGVEVSSLLNLSVLPMLSSYTTIRPIFITWMSIRLSAWDTNSMMG
jgi:hypothetical protein